MDGAVFEHLARARPISEPAEGLCVERDALCARGASATHWRAAHVNWFTR
jgi:hypothetical protein